MIVAIQAISKILASKDYSMVENNNLDAEYFSPYEKEFEFIKTHYEKYGKVPDEISFIDNFPEFELQEVAESDDYLINNLRETKVFLQGKDVLQTAAKMMSEHESMEAVEYAIANLSNILAIHTESLSDTGVVESVSKRVEHSEFIHQNPVAAFIPTGFIEIDNDITGLQRGDELVVIFARTSQGKSWILEKICTNAVEQGHRVGYFSPEMSALDVGYRFDTLHGNVPNSTVTYGNFTDEYTLDDYKKYAEDVSSLRGELFVTSPKNFARKLTVSKLRNWIKVSKLDMVAIDGITYMTDERYKRGDSKTTSLTNISEDLMELSSELQVPILVVVQANRGGIVDKNSLDTPELENIRDSDGIAMNASIVYSVRQVKDTNDNVYVIIENKKMRKGIVGKQYKYKWDINSGSFEYADKVEMPEAEEREHRRKKNDGPEPTASAKKRQKSAEDEF